MAQVVRFSKNLEERVFKLDGDSPSKCANIIKVAHKPAPFVDEGNGVIRYNKSVIPPVQFNPPHVVKVACSTESVIKSLDSFEQMCREDKKRMRRYHNDKKHKPQRGGRRTASLLSEL